MRCLLAGLPSNSLADLAQRAMQHTLHIPDLLPVDLQPPDLSAPLGKVDWRTTGDLLSLLALGLRGTADGSEELDGVAPTAASYLTQFGQGSNTHIQAEALAFIFHPLATP
eukprot:1487803-Amphidinium_carterae.1